MVNCISIVVMVTDLRSVMHVGIKTRFDKWKGSDFYERPEGKKALWDMLPEDVKKFGPVIDFMVIDDIIVLDD